jgi:hypothetical protein
MLREFAILLNNLQNSLQLAFIGANWLQLAPISWLQLASVGFGWFRLASFHHLLVSL